MVVLIVAVLARRNSHRPTNHEAPAAAEPVSTAKYVPAKTEGLGVSVAILIDNSGSMKDRARGDQRPKYQVARQALEAMLATTDSFVTRQPGVPVNVGLYQFSSDVQPLVPVRPYDRAGLDSALESMSLPSGGTAIGTAMDVARADLYQAGTIRKYILVVTDGQNTEGRSPDKVAHEIDQRSEGAVRMYFVAFDVEASRFDFLHEVHGEVLEARNGLALHAGLDSLYRGKILAEALDAGETLADTSAARPRSPSPADSSHPARPPTRPRKPTP
jgi:VWA domain-containing protein